MTYVHLQKYNVNKLFVKTIKKTFTYIIWHVFSFSKNNSCQILLPIGFSKGDIFMHFVLWLILWWIIKPYRKLEYQQCYCVHNSRINTILTPMIGSAIFFKLTSKYDKRYNKRNRARKCRKQRKQIFQANHTFHKINIQLFFEFWAIYTLLIMVWKLHKFPWLIFWHYLFLDFKYFVYLIH